MACVCLVHNKSISALFIVPPSPAYSINFLISLIKSCIFCPHCSIKYCNVFSATLTLYALAIAFNLLIIWFGFWYVNSHTSPFFSNTLYNFCFSTFSSTNTKITLSLISSILFSMYSATLVLILASSGFFLFPSFFNISEFRTRINFFG